MPLKEWLTKKHEKRKKISRSKSQDSILTDDPLSTLVYPNKGANPSSSVEQIYAVSRVNPIFDDSDVISIGKKDIPQDSSSNGGELPSNSSGFSDDLDEDHKTEAHSEDRRSNTSSSNSAVVQSVSSGFCEEIDDRLETPNDRNLKEVPGNSNNQSLSSIVGVCDETGRQIGELENVSCGHDTQSCLGIPGLVLNKELSSKELKIEAQPFVEELIKKRQNLRNVSRKISPVLNKRRKSCIVNSSGTDEETGSAVSSEWRRSVNTIRKMWHFDDIGPSEMADFENELKSLSSIKPADDAVDDAFSVIENHACVEDSEESLGVEIDFQKGEDGPLEGSESDNPTDSSEESPTKKSPSGTNDFDISDAMIDDNAEPTLNEQNDKETQDCPSAPKYVPNHQVEQSTFSFSELNEKCFVNGASDPNFIFRTDFENGSIGTKRKVTFADDIKHELSSKLLTDEILNGRHILAARGRFTNPLLLKSKLYSIKTSLPGSVIEDGQQGSSESVKNGLQNRISGDKEIKSIMIDELYSSYTFEVQGYDEIIGKTITEKKKRLYFKSIWIAVGIILLVGFVVAITLYLKVVT